MSKTLAPTVGRIVWYRGEDSFIRAAIVTAVFSDLCVNLSVFAQSPRDLEVGSKSSVTHADPEKESGCFPSWHWMPYQIDQAKKAESALTACSVGSSNGSAQMFRMQVLDMALRTPGVSSPAEALKAATDFQNHIDVFAATDSAIIGGDAPSLNHGSASDTDFGFALKWLKAGKKVARAGWNGKGMFVYLVPALSYTAMTGAAKSHFGDGSLVPYNAYMALKGADDTVSTWAPSGSDALADDWRIIN